MPNFRVLYVSIPRLLAAEGRNLSLVRMELWLVLFAFHPMQSAFLAWYLSKSCKARVCLCPYSLWAKPASSDSFLSTAQYKCLWLSCKQRKGCWWIKQKNLLTLLSEITPSTNGSAGSALLENNSTQNLQSVNHPFPLIMKRNAFPYILINLKNIMQIEKCTFVRRLSGSTFHSGELFVSTETSRK